MKVVSWNLSRGVSAIRRHEALLRYVRYLLVYNIAIFLWVAAWQLSTVRTVDELFGVLGSENWQWSYMVLASVAFAYLVLAMRWRWLFVLLLAANVGHFMFYGSAEHAQLKFAVALPISVATNPTARPLAPMAAEVTTMGFLFAYVMGFVVFYGAAWSMFAGSLPAAAYGSRPNLLTAFSLRRLLDTGLPGITSLRIAPAEWLLFAASALLFVTAAMAPFYGIRSIQTRFAEFSASMTGTCAPHGYSVETLEAIIDCISSHYTWPAAAVAIGAPLIVMAVALVLAHAARRTARGRFLTRLAEQPLQPLGATLFLRPFRDDQVRIRRANRNLFSIIFDLGRTPSTLDELMLERLDGDGDLIAIGNPQDRLHATRRSPWGARRLYVDDADWQAIAASLMRDASRIVLCLDETDGVRWEIEHVLASGHGGKTLFVCNPDQDAAARARLLTQAFSIPAEEIDRVGASNVLALTLPETGAAHLLLCRNPERDAYLVAARIFQLRSN